MRLLFGTLTLSGLATLLFIFQHVQDPLERAVAAAVMLPIIAIYVLILRKCNNRPPDDKNPDGPPTQR
jgi:hypothetical protein